MNNSDDNLELFIKNLSSKCRITIGKNFNNYSKLSLAEVQKYGKKIKEAISAIPLKNKIVNKNKIALLGSSTQSFLPPYLLFEGLLNQHIVETYVEEMNQFRQALLNKNSSLHDFKPDLVFWHIELESFLTTKEISSGKWSIKKIIDEIASLVDIYLKHSTGIIYITDVHVLPLLPYFDIRPLREQKIYGFNNALKKKFLLEPRVTLCRFNDLCAYIGHKNVVDKSLYRIGKIYYSHKFSFHLAKKIIATLATLSRARIKCIVTDLDNTLWGGIIGEDGFNGIKLNSEYPGYYYMELQKQLLALKQQGVLLAINSRNNYRDAINVLNNHPNMILQKKDFQVIKINWKEKYENMMEIADDLNLSLDSFMFLDDSDIECEKMTRFLPKVKTIKITKKHDELINILPSQFELNALKLTVEDIARNKLYSQDKKRKYLYDSKKNMEEFLVSLKTKLRIKIPDENEYQRVYQLILKTNQFNLTTIRYSYSSLCKILRDPGWILLSLHVSDKFGDSGLVGTIIVKKESTEKWIINSYLISCRILGREIEQTLCKSLIQFAQKKNVKDLIGIYRPTTKNKPAMDFYSKMGFTLVSKNKFENKYLLDLKKHKVIIPCYIKIFNEIP